MPVLPIYAVVLQTGSPAVPADLRFVVRGVAVPQGSTRAFVVKGRAVTTNKTPALIAWRQAVAEEARKVAPSDLMRGALAVSCYFAFEPVKARKKQGMAHYQRPDVDKLLRAVLDACTGVLWIDDAQVCVLRGQKVYLSPPYCRVTVRTCAQAAPWSITRR